jgi:choline dehydrogenase
MLPKELGGAVDEVLGDYDVDGFRVVDASAAPMLLGANTCQAVYATPEKARDPD